MLIMQKRRRLLFWILASCLIVLGFFFCFVYFIVSKNSLSEQEQIGSLSQVLDKLLEQTKDFLGDLASSTDAYSRQYYYLGDFIAIRDEFLRNKISFLEIHLREMKVRLYKEGELIKEATILRKGDPQSWGGTASGLYKIIGGNVSSFSVVADVYMPYSLHFYGKYYLHGEPYEPLGEKVISDVSGGCVQITDRDAEDFYELTEIGMPVLVIDKESDGYQYEIRVREQFPVVSAKSYLIADLDSGFTFAEKNSQEKRQIASLTKLMTAVVVAENVDLRKSVTITKKMLDNGFGVDSVLKEGRSFSVVELFYPLLIESSNDASEALSYFLDRKRIIELMQEKAKAILMQNTVFTDPSGYDPGNISTAQDLFYLARYIINNRPPIFEITKGKEVRSFGGLSFDVAKLWNKNIFVEDKTFVGGKTGFIKSSLYNSLFIFRFQAQNGQNRNVIFILLGSDCLECQKTDTQKIYNWLQRNYF